MKHVQLPISEDDLLNLSAGENVLLSGTLFTARDAAHKRLNEAIAHCEELPVKIAGGSVYYTGACPAKRGEPIGSCGPTTSSRMDSLTPPLLDLGLKVMVGKGKRSQSVVNSMVKNKAVYFAAIGGAGALYADTVQSCRLLAYNDLLSEAVYELTVAEFPALVAIDAGGNSIY